MTSRKPATEREKQLRLAIHRINNKRAHTKATEITISNVAREAGVTPALIHNHYPSIRDLILSKQGTSCQQQRDAKHVQLTAEVARNKELKAELKQLNQRVRQLASINETLIQELKLLQSKVMSPNVMDFEPSKKKS